jgi:TDG/mug DNA glycosylase family protein
MSSGLSPVVGKAPTILILGSYPSTISLQAGEYYANPRNAFWRVMETIFGVPAHLPYGERTAALTARGVSLWDVLEGCRRQGSSDASIRDGRANDIPGFLREHPTVRTVALNGRAAETWLRRVHPGLWDFPGVAVVVLPSTSPAHARLSLEEKIRIWREAIAPGKD